MSQGLSASSSQTTSGRVTAQGHERAEGQGQSKPERGSKAAPGAPEAAAGGGRDLSRAHSSRRSTDRRLPIGLPPAPLPPVTLTHQTPRRKSVTWTGTCCADPEEGKARRGLGARTSTQRAEPHTPPPHTQGEGERGRDRTARRSKGPQIIHGNPDPSACAGCDLLFGQTDRQVRRQRRRGGVKTPENKNQNGEAQSRGKQRQKARP